MSHEIDRFDWGAEITDSHYGFRQLLCLPNRWTICRRHVVHATKERTWLVSISDHIGISHDPYSVLPPLPDGKLRSGSEDDKRFMNDDQLLELVQAAAEKPASDGFEQ